MVLKSRESFQDVLHDIHANGLYRFMYPARYNKQFIYIHKKKLLNLCSNDYLGIETSLKLSSNQSSSRLLSGNDSMFSKLEKRLATHKSKQSSLVFPTGYMANLGLAGSIIQHNDLVISDSLNHASIIDTCKLAGAKVSIYQHNDMNNLQTKLKSKARKFIITEGVFSMDGDMANLKQITELAQKYDAMVILDDAHGDFVMGSDGRGTSNLLGVSRKVDILTSSLSKALGSFGGYIASTNDLIDLCINKSKSFIYTSALPSIHIQDSLLRINSDRSKRLKILKKNTKYIQKGLIQCGFDLSSSTHILPIMIGDEKISMQFSKYMFDRNVFAQAVRYPTVQLNSARIRMSITARLNLKDMDKILNVVESAGKKFKLI